MGERRAGPREGDDGLGAYNATPPQADGYYAIGDIRRLRGDFAGAEAALREAHARGRSPQPALALIRLAEGKVKIAATAIDAAVAESGWGRSGRARLFPAQAEIAIAAGDLAVARSAVVALDENSAASYPSPAVEAGRQATLGRVLLAEGDAAGAADVLRASIKGWREVGAPYEVARSRAVLSRALRAVADEDDADLELTAALEEFRRLGARLDIEAAERELRDAEDRRSGPVSARMTFMFTDIVGSTNLAEALGDQAWERLLRWHDDVLRNLITGGGGVIVNSTGDGFFAAFTSARAALDAGIAIQRALRAQRDSSGFAIAVGTGLHTADANRRGDDYSGKGVHVAARVAAQASGGEVCATTETLAEAGDVHAGPANPDRAERRDRAGLAGPRRLGLTGSMRPDRAWAGAVAVCLLVLACAPVTPSPSPTAGRSPRASVEPSASAGPTASAEPSASAGPSSSPATAPTAAQLIGQKLVDPDQRHDRVSRAAGANRARRDRRRGPVPAQHPDTDELRGSSRRRCKRPRRRVDSPRC